MSNTAMKIMIELGKRKIMATEFNAWRERVYGDSNGSIYPSYSVENFIEWLSVDGKKWLKIVKPKKCYGIILGYRRDIHE